MINQNPTTSQMRRAIALLTELLHAKRCERECFHSVRIEIGYSLSQLNHMSVKLEQYSPHELRNMVVTVIRRHAKELSEQDALFDVLSVLDKD